MTPEQKKRLRWGLAGALGLIVLTLLGLLGNGIMMKLARKELRELGNPLPRFQFENMAGEPFVRDSIPSSKPLAVYYMHPECEHCQAEAVALSANMEAFDFAEVMIVSGAQRAVLFDFAHQHNFFSQKNFHVLTDPDQKFEDYFGSSSYPTSIAFDMDHKLKGHFVGGAKVEHMLDLLRGR